MAINRLIILAAFTFICFLPTPSLRAAALFGPQSYTRTTGEPNVYTASFTNCESQAQYEIRVQNGLADGNQRLSSATVVLNGQEVLSPNDLNQNVGQVIKPVSVQSENTLEVRLASGPNGQLTVSLECVANCFGVNITPVSGTINSNQILVRGEVQSSSTETGVTINGLPALIQGRNWAYFVALYQGINPINATATNSCGQSVTATAEISANPSASVLRLTTIPLQGLAPLSVLFKAQTSIPNPVYQWVFDGDGILDSQGAALAEVSTIYNQEGLYYPSVTVIDSQGQGHTETTLVQVVTREKLDAMLQAKWAGMRDALSQGDIEQAVGYFAQSSQERYRGIFTAVQSQLSEIAAGMGTIQFISLENGVAKYRIRRMEGAQEITYHIYFVIDQDGIWKIKQF